MEKKLQCRRAYRSDCIGTVKLIDGKPLCTRHTLNVTRTTSDSESRRRRRLPIVLGAVALIATTTASVALTALFTRRDTEQHSIVTQTVTTTKPVPKAANRTTTAAAATTTTKRRYTVTYVFSADSPTITVWYTSPQGDIGPVNYTGIAKEAGYRASITQTFDTLPDKLSLHAQSNGPDNFAWCMVLINGVHKSEHSNEGGARTASCNLRRH